MRKAVMIVLALAALRLLPRAFRQQARMLELVALLWQLTTAAAANTSKTVNIEARTGDLETRVGNLEQGQVANLQNSSLIGQLQQGNFPGGTSISCATLTTTGNISCGGSMGASGSVHVGGSVLTDAQLGFLSALGKLPHQTTSNSSAFNATAFGGLVNAVNILQGNLQGNGFES